MIGSNVVDYVLIQFCRQVRFHRQQLPDSGGRNIETKIIEDPDPAAVAVKQFLSRRYQAVFEFRRRNDSARDRDTGPGQNQKVA